MAGLVLLEQRQLKSTGSVEGILKVADPSTLCLGTISDII